VNELDASELIRLRRGLEFCYSVPFIDDVEDFVWESLWSFVKGLPMPDPLARTKLLFDVTDASSKTGWSAKTLLWPSDKSQYVEFVIQRADIFKKRDELGFPTLNPKSDPAELGSAVLEHWRRKVEGDAKRQNVESRRQVILLKKKSRREFAVLDDQLEIPKTDELDWKWTDADQTGLQGFNKASGKTVYRWYQNQKQCFERIELNAEVPKLTIDPKIKSPYELFKILGS
jgi:hypothetical protein